MARMKVCGTQLSIGDDDLGLIMRFHICFRILNFVCLVLSLATYSYEIEGEVPSYPFVFAFSLDFRLERL